MPLSRPINDAHSAASNFFQNLIITQEPIPVVTINLAQRVVQRGLDWRLLAIGVNTRGKKALQAKAAANARCGSTFCADARFSLKMQRKRTAGRTHERITTIE